MTSPIEGFTCHPGRNTMGLFPGRSHYHICRACDHVKYINKHDSPGIEVDSIATSGFICHNCGNDSYFICDGKKQQNFCGICGEIIEQDD